MKFAVGEIAIIQNGIGMGAPYNGAQCEIIKLGPVYNNWGDKYDYAINILGGPSGWYVNEIRLRKQDGNEQSEIAPATLALFATKQPNPDKVKEKERG